MLDGIDNPQTIYLVIGLVLLVLVAAVWFFRSRSMRVLGIDVGNAQIKIVELSGGKTPTLHNFVVVPTPPGAIKDGQVLDATLLARTLQGLIQSNGFVSRRVSTGLTGQNILLRTVELPAMPKKEVPEAVKWQFDQYFQLPSDEAVSDYQIISGEMGGPLSVMLVAMQKAPVVAMVNTLKEAGLTPLAVDIEPLTVLRAVSFGCDRAVMQGTSVVFDFGAGTTNVSVFKNGVLRMARVVHFGGRRFTHAIMDSMECSFEEAERAKREHGFWPDSPIADIMLPLRDELFLELSRTINFYLADNRDEAIKRVFMLGGGSLLKQLLPQFKAYLGEYTNSLTEDFELGHCSPLQHVGLQLPRGRTVPEETLVPAEPPHWSEKLPGANKLFRHNRATIQGHSPLGLTLGVAIGMALGEVKRSEN